MRDFFKNILFGVYSCMETFLNEKRTRFYIGYNRYNFARKGVVFGHSLQVYDHVDISLSNNSKVTIGNYFTFVSSGGHNPLGRNIESTIYVGHDAFLTIGNCVGISNSAIWCAKEINIGNYVFIGANTILLDTDAHSLDWKIRMRGGKTPEGYWIDGENAMSKKIVIEDNVLIGTRCTILKGVTIGARSIIGSGSVVTSSIPQDCIAAGNPCKVIRYINSTEK